MTSITPSAVAGLLLAALPILDLHDLPAPTASAVLEAIGASRTSAYKAKSVIEGALPELIRPPGRPSKPPAEDDLGIRLALLAKVRDFLFDHPGCVSGTEVRRRYAPPFRVFVLDLCEAHRDVSLEVVAGAVGVPLGTLKDWMRAGPPEVEPTASGRPEPGVARVETVLEAWKHWSGDFRAFCEHVQFHLRIPFGRQQISDILQSHGERIPARRRRDRDASALRRGFEAFFPGAQWIGDGTELVVTVGEQRFKVNLELLVDAHSGALTGASIRRTEDAAAVTEAFEDGVRTTGGAPLALLLDNKPSNHGSEVHQALGQTLCMRPRSYTPTDKPQVEGVFGLFSREAPPLVLRAVTPEGIAAELAKLMVTAWARAANHRPRLDRNGRSRAELYRAAAPTDEEKAAARAALNERHRKQELARETRARRLDPVARRCLDRAFERLGLDDPDEQLRKAIASWPLDAILEGIAVFEGKMRAGTLPPRAGGRYLRGIVRNVAEEREGAEMAEVLLRERLAARDMLLQRKRSSYPPLPNPARALRAGRRPTRCRTPARSSPLARPSSSRAAAPPPYCPVHRSGSAHP